MEHSELQRVCEAILFAAGEPVATERLCFAAQAAPDEVHTALDLLNPPTIWPPSSRGRWRPGSPRSSPPPSWRP